MPGQYLTARIGSSGRPSGGGKFCSIGIITADLSTVLMCQKGTFIFKACQMEFASSLMGRQRWLNRNKLWKEIFGNPLPSIVADLVFQDLISLLEFRDPTRSGFCFHDLLKFDFSGHLGICRARSPNSTMTLYRAPVDSSTYLGFNSFFFSHVT